MLYVPAIVNVTSQLQNQLIPANINNRYDCQMLAWSDIVTDQGKLGLGYVSS